MAPNESPCGPGTSLKREAIRLAPFLLVAVALLWRDPNLPVVGYALGIVALIVMASHLARKALMPYLDMEQFVCKAREQAIASAIVAAAVLYLLAAIIQSVVALLR